MTRPPDQFPNDVEEPKDDATKKAPEKNGGQQAATKSEALRYPHADDIYS